MVTGRAPSSDHIAISIGAGVRRRHDADAVRVGHLQDLARQVDGELQTRLAELRPVRAAERVGGELWRHPIRGAWHRDRTKNADAPEAR